MLLLLGLAVAGHGARLLLQPSGDPPGQLLADQPSGSDPASHRAFSQRLGRPLARGETVDLNTASPEEIARLPRVGMSLAKRIVSRRSELGPFQALADLDRVAGVGPAMLEQLKDKVRFGGIRNPNPSAAPREVNQPAASGYEEKPRLLDLNSATEADLRALPGIGVVRARAILAYRRERGPFAAVSDLRAVPGFSQALISRLAPLVLAK